MAKRVYKCEACGKVFRVTGGELVGEIPGRMFEDEAAAFCPYYGSDRIEIMPQD